MPEGIVATVDEGFVTLDFVDVALRGPVLKRLLDIGGPATIETITRRGPRRQYRVPVGNAREAGLLDEQARGLNVDGSPDDDTAGGTGTTTGSFSGDSGAAAATKAADPNVNPGPDNANWHTPTAEYTSANKFVGQVPNANVLHDRDQIFTGTGTSVDGDLEHPPTHADVIDYVKDNSEGFQAVRSTPQREPQLPAASVANALGAQTGALGSDPGGFAPQPGEAPQPVQMPSAVSGAAPEPVPSPEPETAPSKPRGRPAGIPDGEPDETWRRGELNAYAAWKKVPNPEDFGNKAEVLEAITRKENK